jgi:N-acetylneuraminic acid mutarotase
LKNLIGFFPLTLFLAASIASAQVATSEWAWMGGSSTAGSYNYQSGVYGALGTPAPSNIPSSRYFASSWTDNSGNFWLFGGQLFDLQLGTPRWSYLNDLWEFNPTTNEWNWMGGSSSVPAASCSSANCGHSGVYGAPGVFADENAPGSRYQAVTSVGSNGHLWLFGGYGFDANGNLGALNDLWEFDPSTNQWAWMDGSSTIPVNVSCDDCITGQPGFYGELGDASASYIPGARSMASSWTDKNGNFWIFGGSGFDSSGGYGSLNDLWEFNPSTNMWSWISGSSTIGSSDLGQPGVYGIPGVPAAGNIPGGRAGASNWIDSSGNLWLFGGLVPGDSNANDLNDLWQFNPSTSEWTWMSGSSTVGYAGVYGAMGAPAAANIPGSRVWAANWIDPSGNLWLFGGDAYDSNGHWGGLNDLWEFHPSTNEWVWMNGSSALACGNYECTDAGVYGVLGEPAAASAPGGRVGASSWTGSGGALWLFGGWGFDASGSWVYLNDLWEYQPPAATPTFNVPAGSYSATQYVTITDTTPGAIIYYAIDGLPTTSSSVYSTPIAITSTETLQAIAMARDYLPSAAATAKYAVTVETIIPVTTTTGLSASAANLTYGQTLTLTATVKPVSGATPTGMITFYNGSASLGSANLNNNGVAQFWLIPAIGSYSMTASYNGSTTDTSSASAPAIAVSVTATNTTTSVIASPDPAAFGSAVTFTATVKSPALIPVITSAVTPTGSVSFYDGETLLGTANIVSGAAAYSTSSLNAGSHSITATYAGTAEFNSSTSAAVAEIISPADFSLSASPSTQTVYTGESAIYIVTIAPGTGFKLPVTLSCSQLPAETTCKFSPDTVSGGSTTAKLVVQTTAPSQSRTLSARVRLTSLAGLLLLFIPRRSSRFRNGWMLTIFVLLIAGTTISGCGTPGPISFGTPAQDPNITITGIATTGSQTLTHTRAVTLNVRSLF